MDKDLKILILSRMLFDENHVATVRAAVPEAEVRLARNGEEAGNFLAAAEIIATSNWEFPPELFRRAKRLKWLHGVSSGIEKLLYPELVESEVLLTNARGIFDTLVMEHTLAMMLAWARRLPRLVRAQAAGEWIRTDMSELAGKTLGVIGLGRIGREIARAAKVGFNMRVLGVARRQKEFAYCDAVLPSERMGEVLRAADYIILAVAVTPETEGMIGEAELAMMQPHAFLINIARGSVVQEKALIRALREGKIGGAGLDVFEAEPLPSESELYDYENVIMTSHRAGFTHHNLCEERIDNFLENLDDYLNERPLRTVVDKRRGY
ncbi:MAG: D-2-hydroxyacid dehydrogenase [bacterium]|jgi:D-2-hydroxyacid dehydrogenase (NADP+)